MSNSSSDKRLSLGVSGPRMQTYQHGVGVSGSGTEYTAGYKGHSLSVTKGGFDVGVSANPNGFRASASLDLFGAQYSNPSGTFKPGVSFGVGGSFGVQDDPAKKRTTFSIFPTGGKTGAEFSVSHDSLEAFGKHMKKVSDPNF